eukprot:scaffold101925_cov22-Tisochrysis_lutea.AAC.1
MSPVSTAVVSSYEGKTFLDEEIVSMHTAGQVHAKAGQNCPELWKRGVIPVAWTSDRLWQLHAC